MSNVENKENPKAGPNGGGPKRSMNLFWVYGIIIVVIGVLLLFGNSDHMVDITVSDYNRFLKGGQVERITILPQQEVRVPQRVLQHAVQADHQHDHERK